MGFDAYFENQHGFIVYSFDSYLSHIAARKLINGETTDVFEVYKLAEEDRKVKDVLGRLFDF